MNKDGKEEIVVYTEVQHISIENLSGNAGIWVIPKDRPLTIILSNYRSNDYYDCALGPTSKKAQQLFHVNLNQGKPVLCAGQAIFHPDNRVTIDNGSGHYRPHENCLLYASKVFELHGYTVTRQNYNGDKLFIDEYNEEKDLYKKILLPNTLYLFEDQRTSRVYKYRVVDVQDDSIVVVTKNNITKQITISNLIKNYNIFAEDDTYLETELTW